MTRIVLWFILVVVTTMGSQTAAAKPPPSIKMVNMSIGARVLDMSGQPLNLPSGVRINMFRFGGKAWAPGHWAKIKGRPDSEGNMMVVAAFPADSVFLTDLVRKASGRDQAEVPIGLQVLDGDGRPLRPSKGLRIELYRFGLYPWANGKAAVIIGHPDDEGYLRTVVRLPVDAVTLRNFTLLAQGQGM